MAAPWQGLPVRLERAPHRGAAFALSNALSNARIRSIGSRSRGSLFIGSRSRGSLFIFRSSPAVAPLRGYDPLTESLFPMSNLNGFTGLGGLRSGYEDIGIVSIDRPA